MATKDEALTGPARNIHVPNPLKKPLIPSLARICFAQSIEFEYFLSFFENLSVCILLLTTSIG